MMATMDNPRNENNTNISAELYFLITKFLSNGPFQHVGETLRRAIEDQKILPKRVDWTGVEHEQSFNELEQKYSHIGPDHLLAICQRITLLLNKEIPPSVAGVVSLLGGGRQNVLRTIENIAKPRSLIDYCTRLHSMPIPDAAHRKFNHNIVKVLYGRETSATITRRQTISNVFYSKTQLLRRTLGHLSAVYCVLFDRTGKYIITGADDLLVKLWSAIDGRLLVTFRGASSEITDIAVNLENTLLAAGSLDHILRVWDMQTASPIAVLNSHTGMITSVNFCPSPRGEPRYLVTTSTDGSVAFWQYTTPRGQRTQFASKPIQYHEKLRPGQAQMIYASFSPGGMFLAAGSADHHVRVYQMSDEGPKRILETEAHSDTVDSIQWAHSGLRFISGSKDGSALVWHFETQQWKSMKLQMSERLPNCPTPVDDNNKKVLKVTMVAWDLIDKFVITAVNDFTIKVWDADTGKLHKVMRGHTDELYVLESHPKDPHILISAGHDGQLYIWDILEGISLASFTNQIDGQGHGGVFDAKWSPDGTMIAATDSHGHILMFGFGSGHDRLKTLPTELFFHTDYRPLIRDANHYVMDEQTQTVPHLMPPPFLVDIDGNPYPPVFQRLVPGRENCTAEQLVPNIAVGPEGLEIVEGPNAMSNIDRMIEALANRQGQAGGNNEQNGPDVGHGGNVGGVPQLGVSPAQAAAAAAVGRLNNPNGPAVANGNGNASGNSPRASVARIGPRRAGDVEGVRQSNGIWQQPLNVKWMRRQYVRPMPNSRLYTLKQTAFAAGLQELEFYRRELRRRPLMINTSAPNASTNTRAPTRLRGRLLQTNRRGGSNTRPGFGAARPAPVYRTRAVRDQEQNDDDDQSASSAQSDSSDGSVADYSDDTSSSDSESSEYSDWVGAAEQPTTLEPPQRARRRPVRPRTFSSSDNQEQDSARPSTSRGASRPVARRKVQLGENGEIPEEYRPPEWLSEVIPRKAPYYPQMGDEVVYFRQGHHRYLEAVRSKNVYKLSNNCEPWTHLDLREHEVVKVIGIKYEIKPPRLCCLKLGLMNNDGTLTRQTFTIKYHDMPDVIDFIVLRQTFDTAVRRLWTPGDRFRCMIDDGWWMGQIEARVALDEEFPMSLFMCFNVRWDNGEYELMSPWDMEPIDDGRLPTEVGGVVYVEPQELRATLYQPTNDEWPRGDREGSCRRIVAGLEEVMMLGIAEPFLAPVDLSIYPSYAYKIEYPIDLSTIKARFENHFYRRITSAQFDVRYLATNAEKFNQTNSHIVKNARIITDLCLKIIKEINIVDVNAIYHQLVDTYVTSDSDDDQRPGTSIGRPTVSTSRNGRRSTRSRPSSDWRVTCREILEVVWNSIDSEPFREPVDTLEHPDYLQVIDSPMDLMTVKEDLLGGNYEAPSAFVKDMRLIFSNSRNYNTNKRSRIYAMTLRLSNMFEDQVRNRLKGIRGDARRTNGHSRTSPKKRKARTTTSMATNGSSSSNSRNHRRTNNSNQNLGESTNDDEPEVIDDPGTSTTTSRIRIVSNSEQRSSRRRNQMNGVSSSMHIDTIPGPSTSRGVTSTDNARRRTRSQEESDSDDSSQRSIHGTSWDEDEGSDDERMQRKRRHHSDSEESYNPNPKRRAGRKQEAKTNGRRKPTATNRRIIAEDDNESHEEEHEDISSPRKAVKRRRIINRSQISDDDDYEEEVANGTDAQSAEEEDSEGQMVDVEEHSEAETVDSVPLGRGNRRRNQRNHDSDQTYRESPVTNRSRRRINSHNSDDHDSDAAIARPTRSAVKRARQQWGQEEDSLEENHDEDVVLPQSNRLERRTATVSARSLRARRNLYTESGEEHEDIPQSQQSQSSGRGTRMVTNRTTRNTNSRTQQDDDDESDDDQVLSQLANQRTRSRRSADEGQNTSTPITNGTLRVRENARRKQSIAATSSSSVASSNNTSQTTTNSSVSLDHNYGEPGPSSLRNRRRIVTLSRHQRNPDELDLPASELSTAAVEEDPLRLPDTISRRLRHRPAANTSVNAISSSTSRRSSRRHDEEEDEEAEEENDPDEGEKEGDEEEEEDEEEAADEETSGDHSDEANASDQSDPDDDTPLGRLITTDSKTKSQRRSTRNKNSTFFEGNEPGPSNHARSTRNQKRRYYNEDSEEEVVSRSQNARANSSQLPKRRRADDDDEQIDSRSYSSRSRSAQQTTNGRHPPVNNHYNMRNHSVEGHSERDSDDDEGDDGEPQISVSSRGRVRKISNRVKNYFRE